MNVATIRNNYRYFPEYMRNTKWRKLTDEEISSAMNAMQTISNCYINAVTYAIMASKKGREILKNRIFIDKNATEFPSYKFVFTPKEKNEVYRITKDDYKRYNSLLIKCEYDNDLCLLKNDNDFDFAMNVAITKMLGNHPGEKDYFLRLASFYSGKYDCEYNLPSKAFKWLTGRMPDCVIGEDGIFKGLKKNKDNVIQTLKKLIGKEKDYSYIVLTGANKIKKTKNESKINSWHCLPIIKTKQDKVKLFNRSDNTYHQFSFDELCDKFKAIVGINW